MKSASNHLHNTCRDLRLKGQSLRLIAETMSVSCSTVRYHTRGIVVSEPKAKRIYQRENQMSDATPLPPSDQLAYLIGVICGDGCLHQGPRHVQLSISCDGRYPDLISVYCDLIHYLLGREAGVSWRNGGTYAEVRISSNILPQLLGLPTGAKAQDHPIPAWIWEQDSYLRFWVRGLIETDGNIYHEFRNGGWCSRCLFCAKNAAILDGFLSATHRLGYPFRKVGYDARLTRTALVKKLALELDITKERTYIQKSPTVRKSKTATPSETKSQQRKVIGM